MSICRLMALSDLPTPLTNVGRQGKSGSNSDIAKSTRLTPGRTAAANPAVMQDTALNSATWRVSWPADGDQLRRWPQCYDLCLYRSAHENSRVVRLAPPQACDGFGQFDGEKGQHEAYHRHCGNQISPDVEGVGAGGGRDRSRPHHDYDTCTRQEPGAPTPHSGHRPKYDGDNESGGQCPEQIGGDAWEIGQQADPNWSTLQIDRLSRPAVPR